MHIAAKWLNSYLQPGDLTPAQIEHALIDAGFEIESSEALATGDTRLDVAITSNRGDALSVVGLAREAAAKTGRGFRFPTTGGMAAPEPSTSGEVASAITLENRVPGACPLFTLRVIKGVKVGPSPKWLVEALESVGQRSINNVVDVTNFINFELGNPCHVFDLAKLAPAPGSALPAIVVREAVEGEKLLTLDGKQRVLKATDVVVADGVRAQGLAGIMGGGDSEVSSGTVDIALEMATWDPVRVRTAARRLQIRTDASHRYERIVDARTLEHAARRAASLIVEVAGGKLLGGALTAGRALEPRLVVTLRAARCSLILGTPVSADEIAGLLSRIEIGVEKAGGGETLRCTIPVFRPDLTREIDLIEEVARLRGLDKVPLAEKLAVSVKRPQDSVRARRTLSGALSGLGFFETVTFSFTRPERAAAFVPSDLAIVGVDDDRRGEEPTLRPSVLTGLLGCRKANLDARVSAPGGVRLYETAAAYAQRPGTTQSVEHRNLGLLMDVVYSGKAATLAEKQDGLRAMRGTIESVVRTLGGERGVRGLKIEAATPHAKAFDAGSFARVSLHGEALGYYALLTAETGAMFGIDVPLVAAELSLATLLGVFPPKSQVALLPEFPSVERDLSPVVAESVTWDTVAGVVESVRSTAARIESCAFIGTYRGKQLGQGKKSVTLRVTFRDRAKTLRHEEVDPEIGAIMERLKKDVGAEFRMG
ncbi:MAG: phenylalanine--tRNA ligase subunit beta [Phycisphaerales bacterium]|nr:phenylalanine--tRNA ligase subunit beta [Phycisphaerales bacterium]